MGTLILVNSRKKCRIFFTTVISCKDTGIRCISMNITGLVANGIILFQVKRLPERNICKSEYAN